MRSLVAVLSDVQATPLTCATPCKRVQCRLGELFDALAAQLLSAAGLPIGADPVDDVVALFDGRRGIGDLLANRHEQPLGCMLFGLSEWLATLPPLRNQVMRNAVAVRAKSLASRVAEAAAEVSRRQLPELRASQVDWIPIFSEKPSLFMPKRVHDWLREESLADRLVGAAAAEKGLVVVLGTGVLQARREPAERLEWDLERLGIDDDAELRAFAEGLLNSRKGARSTGCPTADHDLPALATLRKQLLISARIATAAFGSGWPRAAPILSWEHHGVPVGNDLETPLLTALRDAAETAGQVSHHLSATPDHDPDLELLGAATLAGRLGHLAALIELGDPVRPPRTLLGTELNWLCDCAWHALTFRSLTYPDMKELALQVELCTGQGDGPVRSLEPPATISQGQLDPLAQQTRRAMTRGLLADAGAPSPEVLAQLLADDGKVSPRVLDQQLFLSLVARRLWKEASSGNHPFPPLVVSTTFDLEMERALARTIPADGPPRRFHVLVPVLARIKRDGRSVFALRWLLGSYGPLVADGPPSGIGLRNPEWQLCDPNARAPRDPVIVRINGSPLHLLPRQSDADALGRPLLPALLLRELDSMDIANISQAANVIAGLPGSQSRTPRLGVQPGQPALKDVYQAMPLWFLHTVRNENRLWLVVGARLADWSARSQLFNLLSWPEEQSSRRRDTRRICAIAKDVDQDRAELLKWLDVEVVRGDCLDLIPALARI